MLHQRWSELNTEALLMGRLLILAILFFAPAAWTAEPQIPDQSRSALPPGLTIQIKASPQPATVGDAIPLEMDISMPSGYQAEKPVLGKQLGDFTILGFETEPSTQKQGTTGESAHYKARITAAAYRTGMLEFPSVQVQVRSPEGKFLTIDSTPVRITIRSVLSEKDRNLSELKKQAEMPEPVRWGLWIGIIVALGILSALIWVLWKRRRKKLPTIPTLPPKDILDIAESELRALMEEGRPTGARVKPYYVRLSNIAKTMLEAGYRIHASEQTTSEIMEVLNSLPESKAEDLQKVETLLQHCDLVKFAKYVPTDQEHDTTINETQGILKLCRYLVAGRQVPPVNETQPMLKEAKET